MFQLPIDAAGVVPVSAIQVATERVRNFRRYIQTRASFISAPQHPAAGYYGRVEETHRDIGSRTVFSSITTATPTERKRSAVIARDGMLLKQVPKSSVKGWINCGVATPDESEQSARATGTSNNFVAMDSLLVDIDQHGGCLLASRAELLLRPEHLSIPEYVMDCLSLEPVEFRGGAVYRLDKNGILVEFQLTGRAEIDGVSFGASRTERFGDFGKPNKAAFFPGPDEIEAGMDPSNLQSLFDEQRFLPLEADTFLLRHSLPTPF